MCIEGFGRVHNVSDPMNVSSAALHDVKVPALRRAHVLLGMAPSTEVTAEVAVEETAEAAQATSEATDEATAQEIVAAADATNTTMGVVDATHEFSGTPASASEFERCCHMLDAERMCDAR